MPRRTGDDINELKIQDHIANCEVVLYYRMPTPKEQIAYTNGMAVRKGRKLVNQTGEMRQKYGVKILKGIRDGDFEKKQGNAWVLYSSNPESNDYDPAWKDLIMEYASDLVELLAVHAFERPAELVDDEAVEPEEVDAGDDLEKN